MRRVLMCGVAFIAMTAGAAAADMPDFLRGSQPAITMPGGGARWDGIYIGGQVGLAYSGTDFGNSTRSLVAFMLRNTTLEIEQRPSDWTTLGKADTSTTSYGGFIGYQMQWDDTVVGIEANYNRTKASMTSTDSIARTVNTSDGFTNNVRIDGTSAIEITDYATMRVRGGWAVGSFMPYGFVGVAVGRADVTRTAEATIDGFNLANGLSYSFNQTRTEAKKGDFAYGYAGGFGLDWCLTQNIFVRGEYEYVQFGEFNDLKTHIHTVRAAAGFKF